MVPKAVAVQQRRRGATAHAAQPTPPLNSHVLQIAADQLEKTDNEEVSMRATRKIAAFVGVFAKARTIT
jgi:hypothetical protein